MAQRWLVSEHCFEVAALGRAREQNSQEQGAKAEPWVWGKGNQGEQKSNAPKPSPGYHVPEPVRLEQRSDCR